MKKLLLLFFALVGIVAIYYACRHITKPQSPFIRYASIIPGTYRLGFTNLTQELDSVELSVSGTLPSWLHGSLFRNGPAQFYTNTSWVTNWFDGLAMIHAFSFHDGKVMYTNKFLQGNDYRFVKKTGKMTYAGFMQDPCGSLFKNIMTWFKTGDVEHVSGMPNANVNIVQYTDHFAALTEIPLPIEFDPHTLKTLGVIDYDDHLPKKDIHDTAHPHYDPIKKEHLSYFTSFGRVSTVNVCAIADGSTQRKIIASYDVEEPSYMHSFALTQHFVILTALPLVVNPLELLTGKAFIECFSWKPELGTHLKIINRATGAIQDIVTEPFFAFHTINAFEDSDALILDVVTYPDTSGLQEGTFDEILAPSHQGKDHTSGHAYRYRIDLHNNTAQSFLLSPEHLELPRINYGYNGKDYTYVYAFAQSTYNEHPYVADKLIKLNVKNGHTLHWQAPQCYPGEGVFVPRPGATAEDDGVVLAVVLDARQKSSFLLVLNAADFTELARAYAPHHIPFGIHGQFFTIESSDIR